MEAKVTEGTPHFGAKPAVPDTHEALFALVGPVGQRIYEMVRRILDDLEEAAPWDDLYYHPTKIEEFLRKASLLHAVIEGIPQRVSDLLDHLEQETDPLAGELIEDVDFFFNGIHMSVEQEMAKLQSLIHRFQQELPRDPSEEERDYTCELSADLKGKYTSSIMGAAASLIAAGKWRGVEIEPILFPEKAQEFDRNERLVATLSEVTDNIQTLLEQVPLAELVDTWKQGERVDQYALTPLYSLLGNLGKLMRESSRRALYSGDYHQIQRREGLLAARVNELTTLHNMTWGTVPLAADQKREDIFPLMIQKATELATVLNTDNLKSIVGSTQVEELFHVVAVEKDQNSSIDRWRFGHDIKPHPSRSKIPENLHTLIVLLYDEDLSTFLELLLGSVLKRASLTVRKELKATPSETEMSQLLGSIEEVGMQEPAANFEAQAPSPTFDPMAIEVDHDFAKIPTKEPAQEPSPDFTPFEPPLDESGPDMLFAPAALPKVDEPATGEPLRLDRELWDPSSFQEELSTLSGPLSGTTLGDELDSLEEPFDGTVAPPGAGGAGELGSADREQAFHSASQLRDSLDSLRSGSQYKSFQLIQRLLKQKRAIPPAMVQSMQPFVAALLNELVPQLDGGAVAGLVSVDVPQLAADCRTLTQPAFSPNELAEVVPEAMQRLDALLGTLTESLAQVIDQLSGY